MIAVRSNVHIRVLDRYGNQVGERRVRNSVVDSGLQSIRDQHAGVGGRPDEMGIGSGTSPTTPGLTELETEVYRAPIDRRLQRTFGVDHQMLVGTSDANGHRISEIGTYAQGTLVARALIDPPIDKTAAIQLTASHVITFERAT